LPHFGGIRSLTGTSQSRATLASINLPRAYLEAAGEHARARVVAAGLRLAVLLGARPDTAPVDDAPANEGFNADRPRSAAPTPSAAAEKPALDYWLNLNGGVRHNSGCRWYQNTKRGRDCEADDGRPCAICGG